MWSPCERQGRSSRTVLIAAVLVVGLSPVAAAGRPTPERIERARSGALTDEYQRAIPGEHAPDETSDSQTRTRGAPRDVDTRDYRVGEEAGLLAQIVNWLMWGALVVGIGLLGFWTATELTGLGGADAALTDEVEAAGAGPDLRVIERPLGDADDLAARGLYSEAIHTLLLRTLQELVRSAAVRVSPAFTSREILSRMPLRDDARDALAGLIAAVEVTHFGEDPAVAADYERCRAQFETFATAFRAGGVQPRAAS